jgi:hypothetical protein
MKVKINAFRRVKKAEIELGEKITIIAGRNENGKTSFLQGIGCALSSQSLPMADLAQKDIIHMIYTGQPKASIIIDDASGMTGLTFPDCKKALEGEMPEISIYSAGLKSVLDEPINVRSESQKSRIDIISKILNASPSKEAFSDKVSDFGLSKETFDKLWETIEVCGWDAAYKKAKETGSRLKGQWEEITGQSYGKKVAENYVPAAWDFDLTTATVEQLEKTLAEERGWLEAAIAVEAIVDIDKSNIEQAKRKLQEVKSKHDKILAEISDQRTKYKVAKEVLSKMPSPEQPVVQKCPQCNADLSVSDGKIVKASIIAAEELDKRKAAIKDLETQLEAISANGQQLSSDQLAAMSEMKLLEAIASQSSSDKISVAKEKELKAPLSQCREMVAKAEERLKAFVSKERADKIHVSITMNQKIIDVLSPSGIRLDILNKKIDGFNSVMKGICDAAGWGDVSLNKDMTACHRGWQYPTFISRSAQWRVRTAIQITMAKISKEQLVVIDDVDMLDNAGKRGLLKVLSGMAFRSILGIAMGNSGDLKESPEFVKIKDSVSKIGGRAYWINDGIIQ